MQVALNLQSTRAATSPVRRVVYARVLYFNSEFLFCKTPNLTEFLYIRASFVECTEVLYYDNPDIQNSAEFGVLAILLSGSQSVQALYTVPCTCTDQY